MIGYHEVCGNIQSIVVTLTDIVADTVMLTQAETTPKDTPQSDAWIGIQKNTFTNWVNVQVSRCIPVFIAVHTDVWCNLILDSRNCYDIRGCRGYCTNSLILPSQ